MKRMTIAAVLFGLFSIGCGSDRREVHVTNVLTYLDNTSTHLLTVKKRLSEAVKKDKIVAEDVKEVNESIDKIKEEGKNLLDLNRRIMADTDKTPLTREEMEDYRKKFAGRIEQAMLNLDEETKEVIRLVDQLEEKNKSLGQEVRKKLRDANGEFQQIVSR
jgi:hypothetical protein